MVEESVVTWTSWCQNKPGAQVLLMLSSHAKWIPVLVSNFVTPLSIKLTYETTVITPFSFSVHLVVSAGNNTDCVVNCVCEGKCSLKIMTYRGSKNLGTRICDVKLYAKSWLTPTPTSPIAPTSSTSPTALAAPTDPTADPDECPAGAFFL